MASGVRGVWAIDIGGNCLKALRLHETEQGVEVLGFDYIEHSKILSSGEVDEEQKQKIITDTLSKFVSRNELGKDDVAISIAGHNSFARFIKLPPVESKRIPEIVQFEAVQQIPFDINEVEWDWQLMDNPDSQDTEVGIFAIKNELISELMDHFSHENMKVGCVQIAPMSLYNYALYDRSDVGGSKDKAVVILDMGAENTTLVVCTKDAVWQRSIRIGGNAFTEAIADTFKLRFQKAEKLKRTAPMSKYMRQIFTAMKPVFTDLGSEIQRSLGFYTSSGPGREGGFSKVIAMGGGVKLQGLCKYLQQTLSVPVIKPDSFEKLFLSADVSSAKFHENISDFGVVYGLGVQMLGHGRIETNLLPRKIARAMAWTRKGRNFIIAASLLLAVAILSFIRVNYAKNSYEKNKPVRSSVASIISTANKASSDLNKEQAKDKPLDTSIEKELEVFKYRDVIPQLYRSILACLPNKENTPEYKDLYEAFETGDVEKVVEMPRSERKQLFVTNVSMEYADSLSGAKFPNTTSRMRRARSGYTKQQQPMGMDPMMLQMMMMMGGRPDMMQPSGRVQMPMMNMQTTGRLKSTKGKAEEGEEDAAGFVVIIEGYTPYKNINELMDPVGVGEDQSKYGIVSRLENLSKIIPDCPFELFGKNKIDHFEVKTGPVDLNTNEMPMGIGIEKEIERVPKEEEKPRTLNMRDMAGGRAGMSALFRDKDRVTSEKVLIDPMTSEEMSKVYDIITQDEIAGNPGLSEKDLAKKELDDFGNEKFIERDYWFRIKAKLAWKNSPNAANESEDAKKGATAGRRSRGK